MKTSRVLGLTAVAVLGLMGIGCAKKIAATKPPAAPEAVAPAVSQPAPAPAQPASVPTPAEKPVSRFPDATTQKRIEELLSRIQDAYFDYDRHALRDDAQKTLVADATELGDIIRLYPEYKLTIEGHCDERGSSEYNMALGDARAKAAKDFLAQLGVPGDQLNLVSYGKERPVCSDHEEGCWQKNRRAHIVAMSR